MRAALKASASLLASGDSLPIAYNCGAASALRSGRAPRTCHRRGSHEPTSCAYRKLCPIGIKPRIGRCLMGDKLKLICWVVTGLVRSRASLEAGLHSIPHAAPVGAWHAALCQPLHVRPTKEYAQCYEKPWSRGSHLSFAHMIAAFNSPPKMKIEAIMYRNTRAIITEARPA